MARTRNIKPGFFLNTKLARCQPCARIVFAGLWCHADRVGLLEYDPMRLRVQILPYDPVEFEVCISELADAGFITVYEVDGAQYLKVHNFIKHQNPHKDEKEQGLPDLVDGCTILAPCQHHTGTVLNPVQTGTDPALNLPPSTLNLVPSTSNLPAAKAARGRRSVSVDDVAIPPSLSTPEVRKSLDEWLAHHRAIRKPYYDPAFVAKLFLDYVDLGPASFIAAVNFSIANNYQGLVAHRGNHEQRNRQPGVNHVPGTPDATF